MKYLILLIMLYGSAFAQEINKKYSHQDFTNIVMTDADTKELNNTIIRNSCFYQDGVINRHIFPEDMTGVIFEDCNLDNVFVPEGNTIKGGTHKNILIQNDGSDWVLDNAAKPVEPMDKELRQKLGVSIDPKDIPKTKTAAPLVQEKLNAEITK